MENKSAEIIRGIKTIISAMSKDNNWYGLKLCYSEYDEWTYYKTEVAFLADIAKCFEEGYGLCSIGINEDEIKVLFMPRDR